jgi:hypothetical protein
MAWDVNAFHKHAPTEKKIISLLPSRYKFIIGFALLIFFLLLTLCFVFTVGECSYMEKI